MKRIPTFLAGMLTAALIGGLSVTALAASGAMTITVDPINIQVNGQTFQPKDAKGNDVPVFALDGTTYAPLRALAEAYGLTVSYDQEANMATVGEATAQVPDSIALSDDYSNWSAEEEAAYLEFKGMWEIEESRTNEDGLVYAAKYTGTLSDEDLVNQLQQPKCKSYAERIAWEIYPGKDGIYVVFYGSGDGIGAVWISDNTIIRSSFS